MSLLKKVASLGSLTGKSLAEISAVCGEPKRMWEREFTDNGRGKQVVRKKWFSSFCLNFDAEDKCCGISYTHDLTPYIVVLAVSIVLIGGIILAIRIF